MKTLKKILVLLISAALLSFFSACKEQGPAETAGEKIDEAVEQTRENMEEAGDTMKEKTEEIGERIEEAGEELQKTNK
jgi:outer membrane lipoprotein-sorting protein